MRFGAGWLSAGIAALLLTTGCKEGRNEQGTERVSASAAVEQAQERSEKAYDQAEAAQKEAGDQQQEAAQAQKDAEQARGELREAEAKAQTELQQAQQAQQAAQQTNQQAQQTVADAQTSALEAQRQQQTELAQQNAQQAQQATQQPMAQAPLPAAQAQGEQFIIGEVLTASEQEVMVSVRGEPQLRLQVEPSTQIIVDGRQGRAADIQEGSQVRASYRDSQGEQQAVRIEVTSSAQPVLPAAPESGESTPGVQPQQPLNQ